MGGRLPVTGCEREERERKKGRREEEEAMGEDLVFAFCLEKRSFKGEGGGTARTRRGVFCHFSDGTRREGEASGERKDFQVIKGFVEVLDRKGRRGSKHAIPLARGKDSRRGGRSRNEGKARDYSIFGAWDCMEKTPGRESLCELGR